VQASLRIPGRTLREGKLFFTVGWDNADSTQVLAGVHLVTIDTVTDAVTIGPRDERCGDGYAVPAQTDDGDIYFFSGNVTTIGQLLFDTAQEAVRDSRARAGGVERGAGADTSGVDRSRIPVLAGGAHWDCPFLDEADGAGIESAVVGLEVRVAADGRVESITVSRDPGSGFGREARRCALSRRWSAALDRAGSPISRTTAVNVRFERWPRRLISLLRAVRSCDSLRTFRAARENAQ